MTANIDDALEIFSRAREYVREKGLWNEVEWQRATVISNVTEQTFLREAAWVILCSGFRESVVRRSFDYLSLAFCDWESAEAIVASYPSCKIVAMARFGHEAKLEAIVDIARLIADQGFSQFKQELMKDPVSGLMRLPYIGAVTAAHLAKNIGLNIAKPDRHLARISKKLGFEEASSLCSAIEEIVGEQAKVVDLIIWRYLADNAGMRRQWCG